jgi:outer membrane protein assembly factor BamB
MGPDLRASDAATLAKLWEVEYSILDDAGGCIDSIGGMTSVEYEMEFSADQRYVYWDTRVFDLDDGSVQWLEESTIELSPDIFVAGSQLAWYERDENTLHFNNMGTLENESSLTLDEDVDHGDLLTPWGTSLIWSTEEAVYSTDIHGNREWTTEVETEVYDVEPVLDSTIAFMMPNPGIGDGIPPSLGAIDLTSGTILWHYEADDEFDYCGALDGTAAIIIHDQYSVLDLETGEQVTYDPGRSQCPLILPGIAVIDGAFKATLT